MYAHDDMLMLAKQPEDRPAEYANGTLAQIASPSEPSLDRREANISTSSAASPGRSIRVAHVATRLSLAGMEAVIAHLMRGMSPSWYQSAIWCLEEGDVLGQELRAEGHDVVELGRRWRRDVALFVRIAALARRKRIDILHCHDELSWFYGTIGARLGGVSRVLVTMHGRRSDISKRHLWEQRFLARCSTAIVGVSSYLCQQIINEIGVAPRKVLTIRNGIPLEPYQPGLKQRHQAREALGLSEDAMAIGWVGRLAGVKNVDLLLEAAAEARVMVPTLRVVLIGDGPCKARLVHKMAALGLENVVRFVGLRRDVAALLPGLDLYVCSSNYEGISLSILEAMAAARAVIATAVGGNCEIIRHNETGILVPQGDRQALARAIVELSQDTARRHWLGQQARSTVEEHYALERMVQNYAHLYQALLHTP